MTDATIQARARNPSPAVRLLLGGLAVGTLDLVFAWAFWRPAGVDLARILQSIASGLLGRESFTGGMATAALGAGLHYFIATMFMVVYHAASLRLPTLGRRPVAWGVPYGVLLYLAMNFVVLPLSAAGMPDFGNEAWVAGSVAMHAVIGVMCALVARRIRGDSSR